MILTQEYSRVAETHASDNRAWLISPQYKIIPCGDDHETYVYEHRDEFQNEVNGIVSSYALVGEGWIRVGVINNILYIESGQRLTSSMLSTLQDLAKEITLPYKQVQVHIKDATTSYFKSAEFPLISLKDVNRRGVAYYSSKQAALPDSRNLLKKVSLEDLSYPLRRSFLLLDLENKYKKMSGNQIASEFRRNEALLEEKTGWTSDELIRDLNQFLE